MKWLWKNFWLKVIAIGLGLLVWIHVATEKIYNYNLKLPVTEIILSDSLTLSSQPPESLTVEVIASGKQLLRRKWRQEGLRLHAPQYATGRHRLALTPDNITLVRQTGDILLDKVLSPVTVQLDIDKLTSVKLPIIANIETEADDGFAVGSAVTIVPDSVILFGPRSQLRKIKTILTEGKSLTGLKNNVSISLELIKPVGYGFNIIPDSVTVNIPVVPVKTKVIEELTIVVFHAPPDIVYNITPEIVRVEISGPPEDIDQLEAGTITASIDFRTIDTAGKALVRVDCPPGFRVRKTSADSVIIKIENNASSGN